MATIRDVAKLCGVSTATVSNVLNARVDGVSAATRERVLAAVRKLGYRPTALEDRQNSILSQNIALICGDLGTSPLQRNQYLHQIFDGVLEAAALMEWSVTVFVERMWSDSGQAVRRSYDGRCDGVVALAPPAQSTLVPQLAERGIPVVCVGGFRDMAGVSSVDIDNGAAAGELLRYLLGLGHRHFAYFGPTWQYTSSCERTIGLHRAAVAAGRSMRLDTYISLRASDSADLPGPLPHPDVNPRWLTGGAEEFVEVAFGSEDHPTAVICWNDDFARQLVERLESGGFGVPEQVSVAGFDDTPAPPRAKALTTMRQPLHMIGRRAVEILIARIQSPGLPDENVRFKAELVLRESCGRAPQPLSHRLVTPSTRDLPPEVIHHESNPSLYAH